MRIDKLPTRLLANARTFEGNKRALNSFPPATVMALKISIPAVLPGAT